MSTSTTPERKMIDIHMHLILGVDDGVEDEQMALGQCQQVCSRSAGWRGMRWNCWWEKTGLMLRESP